MSGFLRTFRGALVKRDADLTTQNLTAGLSVPWNAETYDTDGFHDTSTNPHLFTIPASMPTGYIRLFAQVWIQLITADNYVNLVIMKAGGQSYDGSASSLTETGLTTATPQVLTPIIPVVAGDTFEANILVESDNSVTILAARSWFAIEVLS